MKKIISTFILLLSIISLYSPSHTFACSCMMPESPEIEMEKSDYVFIGTVEQISEVTIMDEIVDEFFTSTNHMRLQNEITFNNITNIKGVDSLSFQVHTPSSGAACGVNFSEKNEYIVYAHENNDGGITAWGCGRTSLTENAIQDLEAFEDIIQQSNKEKINFIETPNQEINFLAIISTLIGILCLSLIGIYKLGKTKNT